MSMSNDPGSGTDTEVQQQGYTWGPWEEMPDFHPELIEDD